MSIDYKKYPKNWKELREQVFARSENKCQFCGVPNHILIMRNGNNWELAPEGHVVDAMALDGIKFTWIVLTIAHLDHDETNENVSIDRLAALCQRCHLRYDVNEKIRRRAVKKSENLTNEIKQLIFNW